MTTVSGYSRAEMCDVFIKFCEKGDYSGACNAATEIICTGKRGIDFFLGFVLDTFSYHGRYQTWVREIARCIDELGTVPRQNMIYNPVFKVNTCTIIYIMILVLKKERCDVVTATQCPPSARVTLASEAEATLYDKNMTRVPSVLASSTIRTKVDSNTFNVLSAIVNTLHIGKRKIAMFHIHNLLASKTPVLDAEWPDYIKDNQRNDIAWILWKIAIDSGYGREELKLYRYNFSSKARKKRIGLLLYVYAYHFGMKSLKRKSGRLDDGDYSKINEAAKHLGDIIDELIAEEDEVEDEGETEAKSESDTMNKKGERRLYEKEQHKKKKKKVKKQLQKKKQAKKKQKDEHEPIPIHMLAITHVKDTSTKKSSIESNNE